MLLVCISPYYLSAPCSRSIYVYTLSVPNTVMMGALMLPVLVTTKMGELMWSVWSDHLTCPKHHHDGRGQMVCPIKYCITEVMGVV